MEPCRLNVMGASGAGATTLGRAIATVWSVPHADSDDYFWMPTEPAFTTPRAVPERVNLMSQIFAPRTAWVLSGAMTSWGESIVSLCDATIFLTIDPQERMRRLEARERLRRRVEGLEEDASREFLKWAAGYDDPSSPSRSLRSQEAWLERRPTPVLRLDSSQPVEELCRRVLDWDPGRSTSR
ncbi:MULTISPECIES: hypothetical protein [Brachybacterium]|uniref:hypothetical protein n=1 Tax=Brachybacterium TaxID=43668 RepID=UPI0006B54867|nr:MULTISPECIES: hypothetical protein [Brachybacterium]